MNQTEQFVAALTGDADAVVTWQTYDDRKEDKTLARVMHGTHEDLEPFLAELNSGTAGIFVCINETDLRGRTSENVIGLRAVFADCDNIERPAPGLEPSIVVESARGPHFYWSLKPGEPLDKFEETQKAIARKLGSDPRVKDLCRVMRAPGYVHNKGEPLPVKLGKVTRKQYTIDEVWRGLGLEKEKPDPEKEPLAGLLEGCDRLELVKRCVAYLKNVPGAVQGEGGDEMTLKVCYAGGDFGLTDDEFWPILSAWNAKCAPPWEDADLRTKLANANKYRDRPRGYRIATWIKNERLLHSRRAFLSKPRRDTEADVADAMVDTLTDKGETVSSGGIHTYNKDSGAWDRLDDAELIETARQFDGATVVSAGKPSDLKMSYQKACGVLSFTNSHWKIRQSDFFLDARQGVAFRNGFVTVTGAGIMLEPNSPDNRVRASMPYEFDRDAECQTWINLLREIFSPDKDAEQKRAVLQEFIGATLIGVAPQFDKSFTLVGESGNGKSTFQQAITENLFPEETIGRVSPHKWGDEKYISTLAGKLINVVSEMPSSRLANSDIFKAVVTGDTVQARDLYRAPYSMKPRAGHLFACNALPATEDYSDGFWDRFIVLTFNRKFRDMPGQLTRESILETLKKEAPGIMLWALSGAVRLLRNGAYTMPASAGDAKREWIEDVDNVSAWVADSTARTGENTADWLYQCYRNWCHSNGRKEVAKNTWAKRLKRLGIEQIRTRTSRLYALSVTMCDRGDRA